MTNYFEYRLHEIEVLLSTLPDQALYNDERQRLTRERQTILRTIKATEA